MMNSFKKKNRGYTLIELLMVMAVISILASIALPRYRILHQKAYQANAKGNLNQLRTALGVYYSDHEGVWPLANYPAGDTHYTVDGLSLYETVVPLYTTKLLQITLKDDQAGFNGTATAYDEHSETSWLLDPPKLVFIIQAPPGPTPLLQSVYGYNNLTGEVYVSNGNLDTGGTAFFNW